MDILRPLGCRLLSNEVYDSAEREDSPEVYKQWRAADKTTEDIEKLNQVLCYELPNLIDKFVADEMPALEWEMNSVGREKR